MMIQRQKAEAKGMLVIFLVPLHTIFIFKGIVCKVNSKSHHVTSSSERLMVTLIVNITMVQVVDKDSWRAWN